MPLEPALPETKRLEALDRYDVLDTPREEAFDRITRLARRIFQVPIATVTFLDGHRQWFKAREGLDLAETSRAPAICDHAIREARPLVIPDTLQDDRFRTNPFVVGEPHLRFYAGAQLRSPDGYTVGMLCVMDTRPRGFDADQVATLSDLAASVMSELELRLLATTDSLTGALSRRAFRTEADRAIGLAHRHGHTLSCIALDLDHFKRVNDGHGHAAGDAVLSETARTCLGVLRKSDLLGRIGGEEFAILLPMTARVPALSVAEKLRGAVARQRFGGAIEDLTVSASFGVATLDRSVAGLDELLRRADGALYEAKAGGRDRCVAWKSAVPALPARRRVLKSGRIAFNNGHSTLDCTVRSLSETGAGLDVISSAGVPDAFKLQIESEGLSRACSIVRKSDRQLEVAFA